MCIRDSAEPGTTYEINQVEIAVTTYGQENPWKVYAPDNDQPIWTLTVQNPNKVQVSFQTGNTTNVYDFTNQSTENGEPFTDYNTSFAGVKLTNNGVGDITGDLVYKAEFGQNVQFVTAVGIPVSYTHLHCPHIRYPHRRLKAPAPSSHRGCWRW